jgi:hypothetical protein
MFKFIKIKDPDNKFDLVDIEFAIEQSDLTKAELKEIFNEFLRACGYMVSYDGEE